MRIKPQRCQPPNKPADNKQKAVDGLLSNFKWSEDQEGYGEARNAAQGLFDALYKFVEAGGRMVPVEGESKEISAANRDFDSQLIFEKYRELELLSEKRKSLPNSEQRSETPDT